ncbi:MAG: flavodoxin family protein [Anaerolineales bacterium]
METIKILNINASNRKKGNTHFLLEVAMEAAKEVAPAMVETELYSTSGKLYSPCDSCDQCHEKLGYCKIMDDDFAELRDKWIEADAIIYGIPVFHMGVPGNFKNFLDRVGNSVVEGFTSKPWKVMSTITQGTGMATGQESVMMYMTGHAVMMGCIPVGGDWPSAYVGAAGWTRVLKEGNAMKNLYAEGEDDIKFTVDSIKVLAKNVVHTSMVIKAGGKQLSDMLTEDGGYEIFLRRINKA